MRLTPSKRENYAARAEAVAGMETCGLKQFEAVLHRLLFAACVFPQGRQWLHCMFRVAKAKFRLGDGSRVSAWAMIPPELPCLPWCARNAKAWDEKCAWRDRCVGCSACPEVEDACESWCTDHEAPWDAKCLWASHCAACAACFRVLEGCDAQPIRNCARCESASPE